MTRFCAFGFLLLFQKSAIVRPLRRDLFDNIVIYGSYIAGTNGYSNSIIPMLRAYDPPRYVNPGGNKRPRAFAIYIEPWHDDIFDLIDLRKNHGKEEAHAWDFFHAFWIPDLL